MIDKWFRKDIDEKLKKHNIVVIIDESKNAFFLLGTLEDIEVFEIYDEMDEIRAKYEIEKQKETKKHFIIYTQTPKENLKFVREYCETNEVIEIKFLHNYVKSKVHDYLRLNLSLGEEGIVTAAKISVGNGEEYWRRLATGTGEIFDLESQLLPFLHDPEQYIKNYDAQTAKMFFLKINEYMQQDNHEKPSTTLANEVVKYMLDGLLSGTIDAMLLGVYVRWCDSREYKKSFDMYLKKYELSLDANPLTAHNSHPFYELDLKLLEMVGRELTHKEKLINLMTKVNQRASDKQAQKLGILFWNDVKTLLEFDEKSINTLSNLQDCVVFYTNHFYKVDGAIRQIYTEFLDKKELLMPFQEYYKNLSCIFLDKWFKYFGEYRQNQTATLQKIMDENECKTAIIVGDGITYEMSLRVASMVSSEYTFINKTVLTNYPSVTENNMSQIYIEDGHVEKQLNAREKYLKNANSDKDIGFVYLESVDENTHYNYLVSQYKDIDELGDKMNNKALKYFGDAEKFFATKIEMLLKNGYQKVYMITDHGFVLTGQLKESDKIEVSFVGKKFVDERFVLSEEKQTYNQDLLEEVQKPYDGYNYIYFAKSMSPFKSVGSYGFSHGGIAPQELITPFLCWENTQTFHENFLNVNIANKKDLANVTGALFKVRMQANAKKKDIFSSSREIAILLVSNGKIIDTIENILINDGDVINREFDFGGYDKIDIQILDSQTKEQLDKTTVVQNKARDLGGL
ncbi:MAG: hypothetical protein WC272_10690 [Sulfurimonas sp.]|jgi:hypothetical protein